ncbi:MAG: HD-GYP domain-containing protein [Fimbriimonadaceae bacterium]
MLTLTAFGAEFAAISPTPRGSSFAVTGAFIAAIACFWSPFGAFIVDLATVVAGGIIRRRSARSIALAVTFGGIGCGIATAGLSLAPASLRMGESAPAGVLLYMVLLGATCQALGLVAARSRGETVRSRREAIASVSPLRVVAYAMIGALVAVLAREQLTWVLPFTLVPVWAFRLGLMRRAQVSESYYDTITALTLMLQRAHPYTHAHLDRVARTAQLVAQHLGLSPRRAELVRAAAVLHDIGKIAVDEAVLDKPGPLTASEREHVENHSVWGAQILAPIQQFRELVPWIRCHHERPDGTGYPDRLTDPQIPIESKIIAVVDAFDAMTGGDRAYRAVMSQSEAVLELQRGAPTQFDEAVVRAFAQVVSEASA